ncbi:helix-turn-helix domain-containing protein [Streptomyces radiopugnans]|uniref:Helix-turn-helix domain-containing protein n=1 Tax=Streptomyces radiopugnans TaxID=403935 RepID=A0A1H9CM96_9ACTN|nr:helix-turn-helix transcriptional regulator [Streptomyces radiopugnans]SEQ02330.1 Helix-turn-helix domain-containing protein [Streptomyces radiopugnans]
MASGGSGPGRPGRPKIGWEFFGSELRRRREAAGVTQQELGDRVFCSGSYIGQFESAVRKPQLELARRFDEELDTDGYFSRMCEELVNSSPFADYFAEAAEFQTLATTICEFSPTLVPGLLQTEGYARAVVEAGLPFEPEEEIEQRVKTRMGRTRLLRGPTSPKLWVILDEGVLRRPVGGPGVMAEQLRHLEAMGTGRRVLVQILPYSSGAHALLDGSMTLMTFDDAPPVAYTEGPYSGQLLDDPALVARCEASYDHVRAAALPPRESLDLIRTTAEEYEREAHA